MHKVIDGSRNPNRLDATFLELVESPTFEAWSPISDSDIVIAVMGPTGAGKSNFINKIVGATKTAVGDSLHSCTQEMQFIECFDPQGRRIVLVDSPGFNDTELSDLDVLELIANWLKQTYQGGKVLSGLLFLHRISDNRMGNSPLRLLKTFKNICGQDAFQNVMLVTTMWDEVTEEEAAPREQELRNTYWKHMLAYGSRMERFSNTKDSAWSIISKFGPENRRPLLLQKEMVNDLKPLSETTAGRPFFDWLVGIVNTIQKAVQALQRKLRRAKSIQRLSLEDDLRQQQRFLEAANVRLGRYSTFPFPSSEKLPEALLPPFSKGPALCPRLTPMARPKLDSVLTTRSMPISVATTLSSPTDLRLSEQIDPCVLRTKFVTAFKVIHSILRRSPISGLSNLVEMVFKIGEMIEETETPDDIGLLSQYQDLCNITSNIIETALKGPIETIINSFMGDMSEIARIVERTSSKRLPEELLSEQSKMAIDKHNLLLQEEGSRLGMKRSAPPSTTTATEERLNMLIKLLRTQCRPFPRS